MALKNEKTKRNILLLGLLVFLLIPSVLFAQTGGGTPQPPTTNTTIDNPLQFETLGAFIEALVRVARDIGMLVAVLGIVYAGFLKVTAKGDEEKLKKANKAFLWAVIGTAVLLGAWVIALSIQGTVDELSQAALFVV